MQVGDVKAYMKLTIKEKLGSDAEAAANQKLFKQQITQV